VFVVATNERKYRSLHTTLTAVKTFAGNITKLTAKHRTSLKTSSKSTHQLEAIRLSRAGDKDV